MLRNNVASLDSLNVWYTEILLSFEEFYFK